MASPTWANVAKGPAEEGPRQPLQSSIRTARARKGGVSTPLKPRKLCNGIHFRSNDERCQQKSCEEKMHHQLVKIKEDIKAFSAGFPHRLKTLSELRTEIFAACRTDDFLGAEMEGSHKSVNRALRTKIEPSFCECTSCCLEVAKKERDVWQAKVDSVQKRMRAFGKMKFFTPVGSAKAKGLSALRPTLQLQSSYNVAALKTNSMATRPLKLTWKDKSRSVRIVNTGGTTKGGSKDSK